MFGLEVYRVVVSDGNVENGSVRWETSELVIVIPKRMKKKTIPRPWSFQRKRKQYYKGMRFVWGEMESKTKAKVSNPVGSILLYGWW